MTTIATAVTQIREMPRDVWLDLLRCDQSDRWRSGLRVFAEEYFSRLPEIESMIEEALVLICGEVQLRRQLGESPALQEYRNRFPELAEELARQFELDEVLGSLPGEPSIQDKLDFPRAPLELPGYEFLEELGIGASGIVYRARQRSLGRIVAIKVLGSRSDPKQLVRQLREAEILGSLQHSNIVQIHEVVHHEGRLHLVMEYVEGATLKNWSGGKPLSIEEAVRIILILSDTVQSVHAAGILHRDLKPSNVLMSAIGQPKITDFGLAKWQAHDSFISEDSVLGTPCYMAPEQASGARDSAGPTADIYSLGAMFYELLTGRPPFLGTTVLETLSLAREREPVSPRHLQPRIGRDLETVCLKCLAKLPEKRYVGAGELADDLRRYLAGRAVLARRTSWWEKTRKSCRRNPVVATLAICLLIVAVAGFAAVVWKWRDAEQARRDEHVARQEATLREHEVREGLERLSAANELLDRGRVYLDLRRWDDTHEFYSKAIQLRPEHAPAWEERGQMFARLGLWELAATDRSRAFALQQPTLTTHWWSQAVLCLTVGDELGYRRLREQMRERFRGTNNGVAVADLVRVWCLVVESHADERLDWPLDLAEAALKTSPQDKPFLYIVGLADYRAGNYQRTIDRYRDSLQVKLPSHAEAFHYPVLAMAHYKFGQMNEARAAIDQASQANERWIQSAYDGHSDAWVIHLGAEGAWPISNWDYLEFKFLCREARTLLGLELDHDDDDPRIHMLRGRALAGLRRSHEADVEFAAAHELSPNDPRIRLELHRNRGYIHSAIGQFDRAADEFAVAAELRPDDSDLLRFEAVCHALAGDSNAYRQVCRTMVDNFGQTTEAAAAYDVVETCVLQSDSISEMSRLLPLAEAANAWYVGAVRLQAAAFYRVGRFEESLLCFQEAQRFHYFRPSDWAFLAMTHQQLGHSHEASQCLANAEGWIRQADQQELDDLFGVRPAWDHWYERRVASKLLEEAKSLISPHTSP